MGKRFPTKGRSSKTYQNKVKKMKKLYKNLFKASQKKKVKNPQGTYFCDKYSAVANFLEIIKIKKANKEKK